MSDPQNFPEMEEDINVIMNDPQYFPENVEDIQRLPRPISLMSLSVKMMLRILEYLNLEEIKSARLVNRAWYTVLAKPDIRMKEKTVCRGYYDTNEIISVLNRFREFPLNLEFQVVNFYSAENFQLNFHVIRQLVFLDCKLNEQGFGTIIESCNNLEYLLVRLGNVEFTENLLNLMIKKKVVREKLISCAAKAPGIPWLEKLFKVFPNITNLQLFSLDDDRRKIYSYENLNLRKLDTFRQFVKDISRGVPTLPTWERIRWSIDRAFLFLEFGYRGIYDTSILEVNMGRAPEDPEVLEEAIKHALRLSEFQSNGRYKNFMLEVNSPSFIKTRISLRSFAEDSGFFFSIPPNYNMLQELDVDLVEGYMCRKLTHFVATQTRLRKVRVAEMKAELDTQGKQYGYTFLETLFNHCPELTYLKCSIPYLEMDLDLWEMLLDSDLEFFSFGCGEFEFADDVNFRATEVTNQNYILKNLSMADVTDKQLLFFLKSFPKLEHLEISHFKYCYDIFGILARFQPNLISFKWKYNFPTDFLQMHPEYLKQLKKLKTLCLWEISEKDFVFSPSILEDPGLDNLEYLHVSIHGDAEFCSNFVDMMSKMGKLKTINILLFTSPVPLEKWANLISSLKDLFYFHLVHGPKIENHYYQREDIQPLMRLSNTLRVMIFPSKPGYRTSLVCDRVNMTIYESDGGYRYRSRKRKDSLNVQWLGF